MRLLAGLVKWNILAQLALPGVYVWQTALLTAFYLRHRHREAYFLFCIASTVARGWSGWTGLMAVCGFQCLGRTSGPGRRARGVPVHGPAAAVAAAYPLLRRTDTVIAGASLAPGWLYGCGYLAFLLATSFDAASLYWGFGMPAHRLFILSHVGERCCRLVWGAYSAQHHNTPVPAPTGAAGASCCGGQTISAPKLTSAVKAL